MEIKHILNGEDMESVREKINLVIDFINLHFPVTRSYNDLLDKPAIDNIELSSGTKMSDFTIPINSLPSSSDIWNLVSGFAENQAEIIAKKVINEEVIENP